MKKYIFFSLLFILGACNTQHQDITQGRINAIQNQPEQQQDQFTHFWEALKIAWLYTLHIPKSFTQIKDADSSYDVFYVNDDVQMWFFSLHFSSKDIWEIPLDVLLDKIMASYNVQSGGNISQMIENPYNYEIFDKKYVGKNNSKDAIFYVRWYKFPDAYIIYAVFSHPDNLENNIWSIFQLIASLKK